MSFAWLWMIWSVRVTSIVRGVEIIPPDFEAMDQANLRRYYDKFIIGLKDSVTARF